MKKSVSPAVAVLAVLGLLLSGGLMYVRARSGAVPADQGSPEVRSAPSGGMAGLAGAIESRDKPVAVASAGGGDSTGNRESSPARSFVEAMLQACKAKQPQAARAYFAQNVTVEGKGSITANELVEILRKGMSDGYQYEVVSEQQQTDGTIEVVAGQRSREGGEKTQFRYRVAKRATDWIIDQLKLEEPSSSHEPAQTTSNNAPEAEAVITELRSACAKGRVDLAKECFGVEMVRGVSVETFLTTGNNLNVFGSASIKSSELVDSGTAKVRLSPMYKAGFAGYGQVEQTTVFTLGAKSGGWKIISVDFEERQLKKPR